MLLKLYGPGVQIIGTTSAEPFVGRIVQSAAKANIPDREILRMTATNGDAPAGFRAYLFDERPTQQPPANSFVLGRDWHYLASGDVVRIDPRRRRIAALYRRNSPSNFFLVTERCDNFCLMCSQPPKDQDDSWLLDELEEVIPLVSPETEQIGITGGEPALLGDRLLALLASMKEHLPKTAVHILSNGRRFADPQFAEAVAGLRHPEIMLGIPLYSDLPEEHDFVVQARGAFEQTLQGILNLKRARVRVELRFVIHAETYKRLPDFARFVARNLLFVDHVALMGLEPTGFAKANIDRLWIDPFEYQGQLVDAVRTLHRSGMRTSIYNHQLCILPSELHGFAKRSISDWKSRFFDECAPCSRKDECGGFFASAQLRRSKAICAFP